MRPCSHTTHTTITISFLYIPHRSLPFFCLGLIHFSLKPFLPPFFLFPLIQTATLVISLYFKSGPSLRGAAHTTNGLVHTTASILAYLSSLFCRVRLRPPPAFHPGFLPTPPQIITFLLPLLSNLSLFLSRTFL